MPGHNRHPISLAISLAVALPLFIVLLQASPQDSPRILTRKKMERAVPATNGARRALVIGNDSYPYPQTTLTNAVRDATAMAQVLKEVGFQVESASNLNRKRMEQAIDRFVGSLKPADVSLFFYAGHGIQIDGENYLIPVDFEARDETDVKYSAYSASRLCERLEHARTRLNIIILDACRNNAFRSARSTARGLATMDSSRGTFIAFATAAGRTASDNPRGRNGLFTGYLVEVIRQPGLSLDQVFNRVREKVADASQMKQVPWSSSSVIGNFYFIESPSASARPPVNPSDTSPSVKSDAARALASVHGVELAAYEFETVVVDISGRVTERKRAQATYFVEDLGGGVKLEMVEIPGDAFQMGVSDEEAEAVRKAGALSGKDPAAVSALLQEERPRHGVDVAPFFIGRYEVTQAQWRAIANLPPVGRKLNPEPAAFNGQDRPVESVSWEDAVEFCLRLSKRTGRQYRLPSEAEWEYACRARTTTPFHFGEATMSWLLNYCGSQPFGAVAKGACQGQTAPVGVLGIANSFGLYDMHGNVWEWCADAWHNDYSQAPRDGLAWEDGGQTGSHVLRGGSWMSFGYHARSARRAHAAASNRASDQGFRLVTEVK